MLRPLVWLLLALGAHGLGNKAVRPKAAPGQAGQPERPLAGPAAAAPAKERAGLRPRVREVPYDDYLGVYNARRMRAPRWDTCNVSTATALHIVTMTMLVGPRHREAATSRRVGL